MPAATLSWTPSAAPQELILRAHLASPPEPVYGNIPPFDQELMVEWIEHGAFSPGGSTVEVLQPFAWGPEVTIPGTMGRLASPGSAPLELPGVLEARWRVSALPDHALQVLAHEMLRDLRRNPQVADSRCAQVASVELLGSEGGPTRELERAQLGRPYAASGYPPPFRVKHIAQQKTAKRSVTIQAQNPKDDDVRQALFWTLQRWGELVDRWLAVAFPDEPLAWLHTESSKLGAKSEQFFVQRVLFDDPLSFAWPFDVKYPLGVLVDMLHTAHLKGTTILQVTARL